MRERYGGFRVPSARLPLADYRSGWFFVTVVTAARVPWLSRIVDGTVRLERAGEIVADEWRRTGLVRPGVALGAFVAMPDHVHLVLGLDGNAVTAPVPSIEDLGVETPRRGVSTGHRDAGHRDAGHRDAGHRDADGGAAPDDGRSPPWQPGVLGAVVNQFKGACTRRIRAEVAPAFAWQARFYDTIVRDARHFEHVRRYVDANPARWAAARRPRRG